MSENQQLTDRGLKSLKVGEHPDGKIPGLVIRVRETGGRSWAYRYRVNGRLRRLTLGTYPALGLADARTAARARGSCSFCTHHRCIIKRGEAPSGGAEEEVIEKLKGANRHQRGGPTAS